MCFFFRRDKSDGGSALEDAFIMDMLISEEERDNEYDEDQFDEFDDELEEYDDEFFGPPGPETPEERASGKTRPRGRGCEITLSDLIFWETIFGDDD